MRFFFLFTKEKQGLMKKALLSSVYSGKLPMHA